MVRSVHKALRLPALLAAAGAVGLAYLTVLPPGAQADTGTSPVTSSTPSMASHAHATLRTPITITELQQLDFGLMLAPTAGSTTFEVTTTGGMNVTHVGGGDPGIAITGHHQGLYNLTGTGIAFTLVLTHSTKCKDSGGVLVDFVKLGFNAGPPGNVQATLPSLGVQIAGELTVGFEAANGSYSCDYSVSASYD